MPLTSDMLIAAVDEITIGRTRLDLTAWDDLSHWLEANLPGQYLYDNEHLAEAIIEALRGSPLPWGF